MGGGEDLPPSEFDIGDRVDPAIGYRPTTAPPSVNDKWYDKSEGEWVYDCGVLGNVREKYLKRAR